MNVFPRIYYQIYKAFISTYSFMNTLYMDKQIVNDKQIKYIIYGLITTFTIAILYGYINDYSFFLFTGFKWYYFSAFSYLFFIPITLYLSERKMKNTYHALDYTIQSANGTGLLYELPHYLNRNPLISAFTIHKYILMQFLSILFAFYKLHYYGTRINKKMILTLIIYTSFQIIVFMDYRTYFYGILGKYIRLPTMLLFIILLYV